jgi:hypothetical protein
LTAIAVLFTAVHQYGLLRVGVVKDCNLVFLRGSSFSMTRLNFRQPYLAQGDQT